MPIHRTFQGVLTQLRLRTALEDTASVGRTLSSLAPKRGDAFEIDWVSGGFTGWAGHVTLFSIFARDQTSVRIRRVESTDRYSNAPPGRACNFLCCDGEIGRLDSCKSGWTRSLSGSCSRRIASVYLFLFNFRCAEQETQQKMAVKGRPLPQNCNS